VRAEPESFRVHGAAGPLVDGELERATAWVLRMRGAVAAD
jgi:hypothetical protein